MNKLQKLNQKPFRRWELYILLVFPWIAVGALLMGFMVFVRQVVVGAIPIDTNGLVAIIMMGVAILLGVYGMVGVGVSYLRRYQVLDGIYQQYLKEHEEQIAKAKTKGEND